MRYRSSGDRGRHDHPLGIGRSRRGWQMSAQVSYISDPVELLVVRVPRRCMRCRTRIEIPVVSALFLGGGHSGARAWLYIILYAFPLH